MDLQNKSRIDRLVAPKWRTYEAVGDYMMSKKLTKEFPKAIKGDDVIGNVAVNLSMAKRNLYDTEQRLKAKRQYEEEKRKELDRKWKELEQKELELRENFVQFNEFIVDNQHKRIRGENQKEYYKELSWERTQNTRELVYEYRQFSKTKKLIENELKEYEIFEDFLHHVVKEYPADFKSIMDLIRRYETLLDAKLVLATKHQSDLNMLETEKDKLKTMTDDFHQRIQTMHTKLAIMVQRYDKARANCLMWERIMVEVRNCTMDKVLEVYEVRTACTNLYAEICRNMGIEPIYEGNIEMQLFCIRKALRDLHEVNRKVREARQKDLTASERTLISGSSR